MTQPNTYPFHQVCDEDADKTSIAIIKAWKETPALKSEFGSFKTYTAWARSVWRNNGAEALIAELNKS